MKHRLNRIWIALLMRYNDNQPLYQLIFIIGGLLLIVALVFAGYWWSQRDTRSIEDREPVSLIAELDRDRPATLRHLVDRVYTAHGGRGVIEEIHSLLRHGILTTAGGDQRVSYTLKRPNMLSYTLEAGGQRVRISYNGDSAWLRQTMPDGTRIQTVLPPDQRDFIDRNTLMSQPVSAFLSDLESLVWHDDAFVGEHPCYVIEWREPEFGRLLLYIDKERFLVRQRTRERLEPDDDGTFEKITAVFSDFRRQDGTWFAFREEVFQNDEPLNVFTIEQITVNPGLVDRYFTLPEELSE